MQPRTYARTIDGFQPVPRVPAQAGKQKPPHTAPFAPAQSSAQRRPFQQPPGPAQRSSFWSRMQLPLLITGCMAAGFLVQSLLFGLVAITAYAAIAAVLRISSRVTFMLAFMALVTVVVLLAVKSDTALAGNFATYTFLLLVIGVIALAVEARPPKRRQRPKRLARGGSSRPL